MALGNRSLPQHVGCHGQPQSLRQADHHLGQSVTPQPRADVERGPFGRGQHGANLADHLVEGIGLGEPRLGLQLEHQPGARRGDFRVNPVAGYFQVSRPLRRTTLCKTRSIVSGADTGSSRMAASIVTSR